MITIFNRKELTALSDRAQKNQIKAALDAAQIEYKVEKLPGGKAALGGDTRYQWGEPGENLQYAYLYRIFVQRDDYARARAAISE